MGADRSGMQPAAAAIILLPYMPHDAPATGPVAGFFLFTFRPVERGACPDVIPFAVVGTVQEAPDFFAEEFGNLPYRRPERRPSARSVGMNTLSPALRTADPAHARRVGWRS